MVCTVINSSIIGIEMQKLNNLNKFENYIDLVTHFHLKRYKRNNCGDCKFVDSLTNTYIENFGKKPRDR